MNRTCIAQWWSSVHAVVGRVNARAAGFGICIWTLHTTMKPNILFCHFSKQYSPGDGCTLTSPVYSIPVLLAERVTDMQVDCWGFLNYHLTGRPQIVWLQICLSDILVSNNYKTTGQLNLPSSNPTTAPNTPSNSCPFLRWETGSSLYVLTVCLHVHWMDGSLAKRDVLPSPVFVGHIHHPTCLLALFLLYTDT